MSKRYELCVQVLDAFKAWDIEAIMSYRAEDCIHEIAPKSLEQAPRDNAAYRAYFNAQIPLFQNFNPTAHEILVDEAQNKAAIWCSSTADSVVGPYANEYALFLWFNEAGDKVVRIVEFVDSDFSRKFFGKMGKFAAEQQQAAAAKMS